MLAKQRAEYALRAAVENNTELKEMAGAWDKIASAQTFHKRIYLRRVMLERGQAFNSELFNIARILVRMADEDLKPDQERLAEYRDSGRPSLLQRLYSDAPIYNDFEETKLADSLSVLVTRFGKNHSLVIRVLEGQDPATRAASVIGDTNLKDPMVRRLIARGGKKAIETSYDPMILMAKTVDKAARAVRKSYEDNVEESERQQYAQIAKAVFATQGTSTYPDATFTLRLSFGLVKGYREGGGFVAPMTTMGGAFEHEAKHGGKEPWKLPESWHRAKGTLDLNTPFNFVSTADIIGGNSGSPVVNRSGELVGLIFDGNIHSLMADYFYSDEQNRSVSVHSGAMKEAMHKIYNASDLAQELGK